MLIGIGERGYSMHDEFLSGKCFQRNWKTEKVYIYIYIYMSVWCVCGGLWVMRYKCAYIILVYIHICALCFCVTVYKVSQSLNILLTVCIHEKMVSFCFYSVSNGQQSRIGTKSSGGYVNARPNTTESCCHCSLTESTVAPPRPHNLVWQNRNHQGLQIF